MKKLLITIIIASLVVIVLHWIAFGTSPSKKTISDTLFIVGIMMFFFSITSISGAHRVFITLGYSMRSVFGIQHRNHENLYEYTMDKESRRKGEYGLQMMIVGIVFVVVSVILAFQVINIT